MDLYSIFENYYRFNCLSSDIIHQMSGILGSLAVKICKGSSSLSSGTNIHIVATAFLKRLVAVKPLGSLSNLADSSLIE